jgi:hypothetical protein
MKVMNCLESFVLTDMAYPYIYSYYCSQCHADWYKFTEVSEVHTASIIGVKKLIALKMEAIWASETLVNVYQSTWCYSPEDCLLRTHCCENLKSYHNKYVFTFN